MNVVTRMLEIRAMDEFNINGKQYRADEEILRLPLAQHIHWVDGGGTVRSFKTRHGETLFLYFWDSKEWVKTHILGKPPFRYLKPVAEFRSAQEGRDWAIAHRTQYVVSPKGVLWMFGHDGLWRVKGKNRADPEPSLSPGPLDVKLRPANADWND